MIDLHTHHYRCGHAKGKLEAYVNKAIDAGLAVIGLSDHCPLFASPEDEAAPGMHMPKSQFALYVREALELKEHYKDDIEILVGVEADYIPGTKKAYAEALAHQPLDYVMGAVHYFDGFHVYDPKRWREPINVNEVHRRYFKFVQEAARSGLFDVLAHIDAVKGLKYWASEDLSGLIDETVEVIGQCGLAVEINTSGIRKCGELFPSADIIEKLHRGGVSLTFGSDAHTPEEVHYGWKTVRELLQRLGVQELTVFCRREPRRVPLV